MNIILNHHDRHRSLETTPVSANSQYYCVKVRLHGHQDSLDQLIVHKGLLS